MMAVYEYGTVLVVGDIYLKNQYILSFWCHLPMYYPEEMDQLEIKKHLLCHCKRSECV